MTVCESLCGAIQCSVRYDVASMPVLTTHQIGGVHSWWPAGVELGCLTVIAVHEY